MQLTVDSPQSPDRVIFHADMDAFYASVEQRDNPTYRGKPVIVGALPGNRGVVSAASYEARTFGVHSAMPIAHAYARCPHGIYARPHMSKYIQESKRIISIFREFSPLVEQISVDEAFIDMTGTDRLWGPPRKAAEVISKRIQDDCSLTVSVGIAPNKFLAKLASDLNKPNGITEVPFDPDDVISWLAPLNVAKIWGVGKKSQEALATWGIRTIGDLQALTVEELKKRFGKHGESLFNLSRGVDSRLVGGREAAKSISREHTYGEDCGDRNLWKKTLLSLAGDVARRARKSETKGAIIVLTWRTPDFQRRSRRRTLADRTDTAKTIYDTACEILAEIDPSLSKLRLIGVGLTGLGQSVQLDLFADTKDDSAWHASEEAMDAIADRFGHGAIQLAGEMDEDTTSPPEESFE